MRKRLICKRCHRLRPIKERGYCAECGGILRAAEQPKPVAAEAATDDGYEEFAQGLIMAHAFSFSASRIAPDEDRHAKAGRYCKCGNPSTSEDGSCAACIEKWAQELSTGLVEAGETPDGAFELEDGTVFDLSVTGEL